MILDMRYIDGNPANMDFWAATKQELQGALLSTYCQEFTKKMCELLKVTHQNTIYCNLHAVQESEQTDAPITRELSYCVNTADKMDAVWLAATVYCIKKATKYNASR